MSVESRHAVRCWVSCGAASLMVVACSFPGFFVLPGGAGSSAGGGSGLGGSAGQSLGGSAGEPIATGGTGNESGAAGTVGAAGAAGAAGEAGASNEGPCGAPPVPLHCSNSSMDVDESDVDCGGRSCEPCGADETCSGDADCAIGSCNDARCDRLFELSYSQQKPDDETSDILMQVVVKYLGTELISLRDISVRYYFSRNAVDEPVLPTPGLATTLPNGANAGDDFSPSVVRQLRGDGLSNDAYFEMAFQGGKVLGANESVDLRVGFMTGGGSNLFTQRTHYSFDPAPGLHESKKLAIYVKGLRVWGRGPDVKEPRSCFSQGVNLGGKTVTIDGHPWLPSPASALPNYAIAVGAVQPDLDSAREAMLRDGFELEDTVLSYPVENGIYSVLAYAWSHQSTASGVLTIQGEQHERFRPRSYQGGSAWSPLGPYRVAVTNGQLDLAAVGYLKLGGFELRLLDE